MWCWGFHPRLALILCLRKFFVCSSRRFVNSNSVVHRIPCKFCSQETPTVSATVAQPFVIRNQVVCLSSEPLNKRKLVKLWYWAVELSNVLGECNVWSDCCSVCCYVLRLIKNSMSVYVNWHQLMLLNPLQTKRRLIWRRRSYRAVNTFHLGYKKQSVYFFWYLLTVHLSIFVLILTNLIH